ncbi:murein L,D-transpeptidase catalytic domain-containing protein [Flavobacterium frigoris]|uniref:L,D-transpeptidase catalytic domain n=1 Tax=Flavobacterium frigoris TaxID=229204 RepID=A0A1H9JVI6_FLAFI|nr:murein L,D-transpeptidase catalytic domain family protein [Flavobacterium frigoris]SEQ90743.1 L,D-transpeptidase catalytic domain [Flavobacterium frigoris]
MRKLFFVTLSVGFLFLSNNVFSKNIVINPFVHSELNSATEEKLIQHVIRIKELVSHNPKYNQDIAFFIDMHVMSGKNRFFVYDLKNDILLDQGLVAHGFGSRIKSDGVQKFSNESGSLCTSLGSYSIGHSYNGQFGKAYKLHGLDATNNKSFSRNIVLHKSSDVPYEEQNGQIGYSFGCPMLNEQYYQRIEKRIDDSKSDIILDIYY